jgi:uncharacterized protein (DUF2267 family)
MHDGNKAEPLGLHEFLRRVAEREGVPEDVARQHARAVFIALGRALDEKELHDMLSELPKEYRELTDAALQAHEEALRASAPKIDADEFVRRVAARALLDFDDAVRATAAVLEALGYRITRGEAEDIEAFLPRELKPPLDLGEAASDGAARKLSLDEFLDLVASVEEVDRDTARRHAQAVLVTLREALPEPEVRDLLAQLPRDYRTLLEP